MVYVDRSLADHSVVRRPVRLPNVCLWVARGHVRIGALLLSAGDFLGYLAIRRGATSSASMLALSALAIAGAILYENWMSDIAVSDQELIYERNFPASFGIDLPRQASNDFRRHRELLGRLFAPAPPLAATSVPPIPRRA